MGEMGKEKRNNSVILSPVLHASPFPLKLLFGIEGLND